MLDFYSRARDAFSLVELSIVIAIISVVAVLGLESVAIYMNRTAMETTSKRMDVIIQALKDYRAVMGRLPCPNPITQAPSANTYGKEDCTGTTQWGSTSPALRAGGVPVRDLNLPVQYMLDGYNTKFWYIVTQTHTDAATYSGNPDGITIRTGRLQEPCSTNCQNAGTAAFVLFSVGADKQGGYAPNGAVIRACINGSWRIDSQNCAGLYGYTTAAGAISRNVFYDGRFNPGKVDQFYFDDQIRYLQKNMGSE